MKMSSRINNNLDEIILFYFDYEKIVTIIILNLLEIYELLLYYRIIFIIFTFKGHIFYIKLICRL